MSAWNMPPKAKIYEALSAVADGRVTITGPTSAQVVSSKRNKTYEVSWSEDMREITSNDNASYWQGYIGYPIITALFALGKLKYDQNIAQHMSGVEWKTINDKYKRDYEKAIMHVLDGLESKGVSRAEIILEVENIYKELEALNLQRPKSRRPPPIGKA